MCRRKRRVKHHYNDLASLQDQRLRNLPPFPLARHSISPTRNVFAASDPKGSQSASLVKKTKNADSASERSSCSKRQVDQVHKDSMISINSSRIWR